MFVSLFVCLWGIYCFIWLHILLDPVWPLYFHFHCLPEVCATSSSLSSLPGFECTRATIWELCSVFSCLSALGGRGSKSGRGCWVQGPNISKKLLGSCVRVGSPCPGQAWGASWQNVLHPGRSLLKWGENCLGLETSPPAVLLLFDARRFESSDYSVWIHFTV